MPVWIKSTLRLPIQVHNALLKEAEAQGISLNGLIVERLNSSVGGVYISEATANDAGVLERLERLEKRVSSLEKVKK